MPPMISFAKRLFEALPASVRRGLKTKLLSLGSSANLIPDGTHILFDIGRRLKKERFNLFFDVGANSGQSIRQYLTEYPAATIFAFEPDPATFTRLLSNTRNSPGVRPFNFGMSNKPRVVRFDNTSPVTEIHRIADDQNNESLPTASFRTIDNFCADMKISNIDYLKIDTEGHDLDVLKGASGMLAASSVGFVVAECSMNYENQRMAPFTEIQRFMNSFGYRLFGLYGQAPGLFNSLPQLMYANCAYISPAVIARNPYGEHEG